MPSVRVACSAATRSISASAPPRGSRGRGPAGRARIDLHATDRRRRQDRRRRAGRRGAGERCGRRASVDWSRRGVTPSASTTDHLLHQPRPAHALGVAGAARRAGVERAEPVVGAQRQIEQPVALAKVVRSWRRSGRRAGMSNGSSVPKTVCFMPPGEASHAHPSVKMATAANPSDARVREAIRPGDHTPPGYGNENHCQYRLWAG